MLMKIRQSFRGMVHTRKCQADANGVRSVNNLSPFTSSGVGDINIVEYLGNAMWKCVFETYADSEGISLSISFVARL